VVETVGVPDVDETVVCGPVPIVPVVVGSGVGVGVGVEVGGGVVTFKLWQRQHTGNASLIRISSFRQTHEGSGSRVCGP
jgi:hypothetical protein